MGIAIFILGYIVQMAICAFIHEQNGSRIPKSVFDFFRMTFFPYLLFVSFEDLKK